ncbi:HAMP domain-containing sensor histidine kinase [Fusibacter bizertensis]|uniref:histidine kinase n=1 Tax=Fusibacter bizertensis TaxID=1488331 RepID=A0ABT6NGK9_9FIRM|nr:HAMP domain-containing sensor histidine kinase [Fusibacter bizertensis]MDH8679532.1 HAMP domain-containing sensor histidine kinase [Fusibacter bizertensis]
MFKKLRNRLLLMNLSIISILMLISFSTIYIMTYNNIHEVIKQDLFRIADFNKSDRIVLPKFDLLGGSMPVPTEPQIADNNMNTKENDKLPKERIAAFVIETNKGFKLSSWLSFFSADDTFYTNALANVDKTEDAYGDFDLDGSTWAYMVQKRPSGYVISFLDMTTQKDVLDRLILTFIGVSVVMLFVIFFISSFLTERSVRPIKEAFDKQKQFISDASHELKTPLAVIHTNVDVLLSSTDESDKKWLKYIKSEVERMGHLTNDLLYLTQMDGAEDHQMMKSNFDISEKIEHILLGLEVVAFEKEIDLTYDILPGVEIYGNSEQLSQVAMILLDNAIKYTPSKGSIKIKLYRSTHHYTLEIENTGEGIPEGDLPKIFDRFYRGDKVRSRESGSYGLGLAIAKSITEQHGGKLSCESLPNEKTTFTLKLKS